MITPDLHKTWLEVSGQVSQADKLFEELEYYVDTENEDVLIYSNYHDKAFWFFKKKKTIYANDRDGTSSGITMQELKAINKKCEELGWEV